MQPFLLSLPPNRVRRNYRGGAQLDALEGKAAPADGDRPEDWIASTVTAHNPGLPPIEGEGLTRVRLQDGRSELLRDLFARYPAHYLGPERAERPAADDDEAIRGANLGFLVKLLDSAMRLHVQAHPTAAFARKHLNSRWGKLETYVILGFRPGVRPYIRLGFQRPPSRQELKRIVLEQDLRALDACFDPVPVRAGEVWVVPGGLPHAIGEGVLMLEAMEPTDLVVRCEFEREGIVVPPVARFMGRDPDFALSIFDLTPVSVEAVRERCRVAPRLVEERAELREEQLIGPRQTDCFAICRRIVSGAVTVPGSGRAEVGVAAEGEGTVSVGGETVALRRGSKFFVAAAAQEVTFRRGPRGALVLLLCRPGDAAG